MKVCVGVGEPCGPQVSGSRLCHFSHSDQPSRRSRANDAASSHPPCPPTAPHPRTGEPAPPSAPTGCARSRPRPRTSTMTRILCLGMSALDAIYRVPAIPATPTKVLATAFIESGGGMAANASVGVARLGGQAHYWGRVGDDSLGDRIVADLAREGVDVSAVRRLIGLRVAVSRDPDRPRRRASGLCLQRPATRPGSGVAPPGANRRVRRRADRRPLAARCRRRARRGARPRSPGGARR